MCVWVFFRKEPPGSAYLVNKANMSTNSTVTEEFVCLSGDWNILKACRVAEKWH